MVTEISFNVTVIIVNQLKNEDTKIRLKMIQLKQKTKIKLWRELTDKCKPIFISDTIEFKTKIIMSKKEHYRVSKRIKVVHDHDEDIYNT